ncbi:hypothetical protein ACHHYP_15068, partial [Achlya hypogyna]
MRVASSLLQQGLVLQSVSAGCPYTQYSSTYTVDFCDPDAILCVVDSACEPLHSYTNKDIVLDDTNTKTLKLTYSAEHLAQLPYASPSLQFINAVHTVGDISNSTVALLNIVNTPGLDLSGAIFPPQLTHLDLRNCELQTLPANVAYNELSEFYGLGNRWTQIANIDLRGTNDFNFNDCPSLTALSNVSFSSRSLTKFYATASTFTTFLIDPSTYDVLNGVSTFSVKGI